ncbi:DUF2339 domain-containing protein [candidate division KSB1 bacterium]|nr:DUF2339 domain-containing protein [candidate division KSB1 bacterium]
MNQANEPHPLIPEELGETLRRLEARLARIEAYLQLTLLGEAEIKEYRERLEAPISPSKESEEERETALERRIGEFWLARVGIVALLVGTAFFIAYPIAILPPLVHSSIGYFAVAGLFFFSRVWRVAYPYLSRILFGGGLILLYYATLRLHFFTEHPVIANKAVALAGLIAVVGVHFYFAARRKSGLLTGIAVFLGYVTALMGDAAHFTLPMVAVTAAVTIYFLMKYHFQTAVLLSVVLAYLAHLLWLLGNPVLGHPLQAVAEHQNNLVYLFIYAAIFARFETPQYFIWLGWQSLLVISTAIWFRSKIVVLANTLIYLGIFLAYLILAPSTGGVNASYAIVALLSARLLNWKTERLALKTELMRNAYLASAFVIIPYGLYHAVPKNYVSLSWLGAAVFYFIMSLILKNKKYRWMAILTIFLAVIYVFVVDMARLEAGYRILSFLALGVVLLVISLLYARSRKQASTR